jgi:hypothetical protein
MTPGVIPFLRGADFVQSQQIRVGLCKNCRHADVVRSAKGGEFYRCLLSETDPRFPKYPRLPVVRCEGFSPIEGEGQHTAGQRRP